MTTFNTIKSIVQLIWFQTVSIVNMLIVFLLIDFRHVTLFLLGSLLLFGALSTFGIQIFILGSGLYLILLAFLVKN